MSQENSSPDILAETSLPARWRVELLGGLQARSGEKIITRFRSRQTGALLAFLAFHRGRSFRRAALIEMLWPGCDEKAGRNRLSVALSALREGLESETPLFEADRDSVALRAEAVTTDVAGFESCLKIAAHKPEAARELLQRALKIYRGALLPGHDEDWIGAEARRLEEEYFRAARRLIALHRENGERGAALRVAQRAVLIDPTREDAQRELIRLLAQTGQLEAARKQGKEVARVLSEQLDCAPDATTRVLLDDLEERAQTQARRARSGSPARVADCPAPLTRFFGRADDLDFLRAWLETPDERLLTLAGSGGSGKTRLAAEACRALENHSEVLKLWPSGAWFVPLSEVSDATQLPETLRSALHLPPVPGVEAMAQVVEVLASGAALLVLDNFEQLLPEGAAWLQSLLESAPQLKVVVTSRRKLGVAGEREWMVSPLPVKEDETQTIGAAVALFEDRARLARPDFAPASGDGKVVALCARLDGLPLALELAAARCNVLSPHEIMAHLDDHSDVLESSQATTTPRHRSLRATIEWSFCLLSPELQSFWTRLSVFRGGWMLDAAREIGGEKGALNALTILRDCSLVMSHEVAGETRFSMLETLREFAAEALPANARQAAQRLHAEYSAGLAEANARGLAGVNQAECLARLNVEADNLRAALDWAIENDAVLSLRLAAALGGFWEMRSRFAEGRACLLRTLAAAPQSDEPMLAMLRAWVECGAGRLLWQCGESQQSRECLENSLNVFERLGDQNGQVQALNSLGWAIMGADSRAARDYFLRAIEIARQLPEVAGAAHIVWGLVAVSETPADLQATLAVARERHEYFSRRNDEHNVAYVLGGIGHICYFLGEWDEARAAYEASAILCEKLGDPYAQSGAVHGLANLARVDGDLETSCALMNHSLRLSLGVDNLWGTPHLAQCAAYIAIARKDFQRAVRLLGALNKMGEIPAMFGSLRAPVSFPELQSNLQHLETAMEPADFSREWQRGRLLDFDAAMQLALDVTSP